MALPALGLILLSAPGCDRADEASQPTPAAMLAPGLPSDSFPDQVEAISLLGQPLARPELSPEVQEGHTARLAEARRAYEASPGDPDALVWLGRRTAYLGEYGAAIDLFSQGIAEHPDDPRFLRHRGHRYLTVRELELARADLLRAVDLVDGREDRIEPDGLPNAAGLPRTTLHFNIWYHLGLAHYALGELEQAVLAWQEALDVSRNDDARVAATYWLHNALRRLNLDRTAGEVLATVQPEMEILENGAYHELLLLHQGALEAEDLLGPAARATDAGPTGPAVADATRAYGVAVWHLVNGRRESAFTLMESIVANRDAWAAFGYLAAEADLARSTE